MNKDVIDLFDEELDKKEKKIKKDKDKIKRKEEKIKLKNEKELEKKEDLEFTEYFNKIKKNDLVDAPVKEKKITNNIEKEENFSFIYIFKIILSIVLIVICVDYIIYNSITNFVSLKVMINSFILVLMVIFYLLSIFIKKNNLKQLFQILSIISISTYMLYHLITI